MSFSDPLHSRQRSVHLSEAVYKSIIPVQHGNKITSVFQEHLRPEKSTLNLILELPPELRNHVYDLTLGIPPAGDSGPRSVFQKEPGLLLTCKQIRSEATSIFYGTRRWKMSLRLGADTMIHFVSRMRDLVAMHGSNPFMGIHINVTHHVWPHLQNMLPLLELMRETGFDPARERYVPQPTDWIYEGKRCESRSSVFNMCNSMYSFYEKGNVQLVLESALVMARRARAEGWSAEELAKYFARFVSEQFKRRGKSGKMLADLGPFQNEKPWWMLEEYSE